LFIIDDISYICCIFLFEFTFAYKFYRVTVELIEQIHVNYGYFIARSLFTYCLIFLNIYLILVAHSSNIEFTVGQFAVIDFWNLFAVLIQVIVEDEVSIGDKFYLEVRLCAVYCILR
jgi:hypothetical protein